MAGKVIHPLNLDFTHIWEGGVDHFSDASKNWIAGAIKHKGALHRELGVPQGQKIPAKKLAAAAAKGGTIGKRARLAQTLGKLRKGK